MAAPSGLKNIFSTLLGTKSSTPVEDTESTGFLSKTLKEWKDIHGAQQKYSAGIKSISSLEKEVNNLRLKSLQAQNKADEARLTNLKHKIALNQTLSKSEKTFLDHVVQNIQKEKELTDAIEKQNKVIGENVKYHNVLIKNAKESFLATDLVKTSFTKLSKAFSTGASDIISSGKDLNVGFTDVVSRTYELQGALSSVAVSGALVGASFEDSSKVFQDIVKEIGTGTDGLQLSGERIKTLGDNTLYYAKTLGVDTAQTFGFLKKSIDQFGKSVEDTNADLAGIRGSIETTNRQLGHSAMRTDRFAMTLLAAAENSKTATFNMKALAAVTATFVGSASKAGATKKQIQEVADGLTGLVTKPMDYVMMKAQENIFKDFKNLSEDEVIGKIKAEMKDLTDASTGELTQSGKDFAELVKETQRTGFDYAKATLSQELIGGTAKAQLENIQAFKTQFIDNFNGDLAIASKVLADERGISQVAALRIIKEANKSKQELEKAFSEKEAAANTPTSKALAALTGGMEKVIPNLMEGLKSHPIAVAAGSLALGLVAASKGIKSMIAGFKSFKQAISSLKSAIDNNTKAQGGTPGSSGGGASLKDKRARATRIKNLSKFGGGGKLQGPASSTLNKVLQGSKRALVSGAKSLGKKAAAGAITMAGTQLLPALLAGAPIDTKDLVKTASVGLVSTALGFIPGIGPLLSLTIGPLLGEKVGDLINDLDINWGTLADDIAGSMKGMWESFKNALEGVVVSLSSFWDALDFAALFKQIWAEIDFKKMFVSAFFPGSIFDGNDNKPSPNKENTTSTMGHFAAADRQRELGISMEELRKREKDILAKAPSLGTDEVSQFLTFTDEKRGSAIQNYQKGKQMQAVKQEANQHVFNENPSVFNELASTSSDVSDANGMVELISVTKTKVHAASIIASVDSRNTTRSGP